MKKLGEKSEVIVLAELIKRDIPVSLPFGDNQRYDMIMDIDGTLYKIQVKTANYKEDRVIFACSSSSYHRGGKRTNYKGEIDYFIVYCHENNTMYLIHVDDASEAEMTLRLSCTRNYKTMKWAKDYEFDKVVEGL